MRVAVRLEDGLEIPAEVWDLEGFRRWTRSDAFPHTGRIDFVEGTIELEMSPEELQSHGVPKGALFHYVYGVVDDQDRGQVFCDRARLSSADGALSCEPDLLFVSWKALAAGRARYLSPAAESERLIEVEGAATLVGEVVSASSVGKDKTRLPGLYARAGVEELWLVDARKDVEFNIFHLVDGVYQSAPADSDGYQQSRVLERWVRLTRSSGQLPGTWRFRVQDRPGPV